MMEILDSSCANCTYPGRHPSMLGIQETTDRIMSLLCTQKGGDGCEGCDVKELREIDRFVCTTCRRPSVRYAVEILRKAQQLKDYYTPSVESRSGEGKEETDDQ